MALIRIAIIGLSASAKAAWASQAHLPYLLSDRGRSKYEIVALCNSSVEAAKKAVEIYGLPPATRTYGDPEALATDADVDLVVNCTRVDVHYPTILPSVKAGKNVFVEWPLAQDGAHARELANIAKTSGSDTIIGVQGRLAPCIVKIRELLHQGRIGKVVSSHLQAFGGINARDRLPSSLSYFMDPAVGGNIYTIGYGHLFDQIQYVLGDFVNLHGQLHLQWPKNELFDPKTGEVVDTIESRAPDLVSGIASLNASAIAQKGALVSTMFRRGQVFPGDAPLVWSINGEKGELRLTGKDGTTLHAASASGIVIELHDFATGKVEQIDWNWSEWQEALPLIGRNVAALYEAYANGQKEGIASFEEAASRHEQLSSMLEAWQKSNQ
jgi:predicted dehydrogenase